MRIDAVGSAVVGAVARDGDDAAAESDDFRRIGRFRQERPFEVEQSDAEYQAGIVQPVELLRRGFERFGARTGRYEHVDPEVVANDPLHDRPQGQDRDG